MTSLAPGSPGGIRIPGVLYVALSSLAVGLGLLVASPMLPDEWRLGIGVFNAILVAFVAKSQPKTPDESRADSLRKATRTDVLPPPVSTLLGIFGRRPPRRRGVGRGPGKNRRWFGHLPPLLVLLLLLVLLRSCFLI